MHIHCIIIVGEVRLIMVHFTQKHTYICVCLHSCVCIDVHLTYRYFCTRARYKKQASYIKCVYIYVLM